GCAAGHTYANTRNRLRHLQGAPGGGGLWHQLSPGDYRRPDPEAFRGEIRYGTEGCICCRLLRLAHGRIDRHSSLLDAGPGADGCILRVDVRVYHYRSHDPQPVRFAVLLDAEPGGGAWQPGLCTCGESHTSAHPLVKRGDSRAELRP